MPYDPLKAISEILGEPAEKMRNPANAGYECPFLNSECTKSSKMLETPYPICSLYRKGVKGKKSNRPPVCVCPNRFFERQIQDDVIAHAWTGDPPTNPCVVHEINMQKFGRVDLVVADYDEAAGTVRRFLPVELQAVDITGSVYPEYLAITNSQDTDERPDYGFNWSNVRKRFISQLIAKGFYCHHWRTRIVAVVQEDLFVEFNKHAALTEVALEASNIVFLLYQFVWLEEEGRWSMIFQRAVPTTHSAVMNAILYELPPDKAAFEQKIIDQIKNGDRPAGIPIMEGVGELLPEEPSYDED